MTIKAGQLKSINMKYSLKQVGTLSSFYFGEETRTQLYQTSIVADYKNETLWSNKYYLSSHLPNVLLKFKGVMDMKVMKFCSSSLVLPSVEVRGRSLRLLELVGW